MTTRTLHLPPEALSHKDKTAANVEKIVRTMRRNEARMLPAIIAILEQYHFDCSEILLLGEGSESSAFEIIGPDGQDRVLKISSPLNNGWEPDWGRRPFDAQLIDVAANGEIVNELECGCFWYVQEYGETYERGDDIPDYLWEEFQELSGNYADNLFIDDTDLVKQLAVVERDGIEQLVVIDYAAFCAQDQNPAYSRWDR